MQRYFFISNYVAFLFLLQTKKAILDTELDLMSKSKGSTGADTSELRKKVAELKKEVRKFSILKVFLHFTPAPTHHDYC